MLANEKDFVKASMTHVCSNCHIVTSVDINTGMCIDCFKSRKNKIDLNKAYIQMFVNIRGLINDGHHAEDIKLDNENLVTNIMDQCESFQTLCEI